MAATITPVVQPVVTEQPPVTAVTMGTPVENPPAEAKVETPPAPAEKTEGNVGAAEGAPEQELAARNKAERQKRAARREVEALRAEKDAAAKELAEWKAWQAKVKEDPRLLLEKAGIDLDTLLLAHLNDGKVPPEKQAEAKIQEIEKKLTEIEEQKKAEQAHAQQAHVQAQVNGYINEMKAKVEADKDAFEFCALNGDQALNDAWQLAEEYFKAEGKVPDPASVIEQLEKMYEDEAYEKAAKSKKLAAKLQPKAAVPQKKVAPVVGSTKTQPTPAPAPKVVDWAEHERKAIAEWRRSIGRPA